jgi:hypothetical protein
MMIRWFQPGFGLNTLLSLMVFAAAETAVAAAAPESVPSGGTPTAEAWSDTLHVAAPRVTLDEIMADIGRRQRANRDSLRSVAFTAVVTTARSPDGVATGAADSAGTWELEESALRYHQDRGQPDRVVQLWERKQKIERGVAQPAKVTPTGKPRWQPRPADMVNDLPFAEGGARLYRYELLASKLVGNSLVHVVGFAPRDRFAALPSGTVWVDIADWAIRRVEARFEGPVPFPWIIRSVPYYRLNQAPCGNVWFPVLESARVDLRDLPLVDAGGTYQIRVELRDIVINGEPCDGGGLNADTDEGAALFWAAIDDMWQAELPAPLQQPLSLAPAQVDSLSRAGASMLAAAPELPPYGLRWYPLLPAYNRAQGFVPRAGAVYGRSTGGALRLEAQIGAGLDDRRVLWGLSSSLRMGESLSLRAGAERATASFAGDGRAGWRSWSALLWGADPNHYYDRTSWNVGARWQREGGTPWLDAGWTQARELPLAVHQRWNVLGRTLSPAGMREAAAVDIGTAHVTAGVRWGALTLRGGVAAHRMQPRIAGVGDDDVDFGSWHWSARWQRPDALGNRWSLRAGGRGVDGPAPAQHRVWLGDWQPGETSGELAAAGALSGWPAGTLLGDRGLWGSLAVDLNVDPWRALRVPGLGEMGLRPLVFVEWGGVWGNAGLGLEFGAPGAGFVEPVTGWRADAGFGFSRRLDLPLVGVGSRFEVRAARAVGEGAGGREWRVLVGIGK